MKGLRTRVLTYMSQRDQEGTAIYDLQRALHYSTQTAKNILQSFLKNRLIEVRLPAKGDSLRGRIPYALTPLGKELVRLMEHLQKKKIISEDNDLDLFEPFRQSRDQALKLQQAGFSIEDWERAMSCGLITEKRKIASEYAYGQSIDPSKPDLPMRLELYSYSLD